MTGITKNGLLKKAGLGLAALVTAGTIGAASANAEETAPPAQTAVTETAPSAEPNWKEINERRAKENAPHRSGMILLFGYDQNDTQNGFALGQLHLYKGLSLIGGGFYGEGRAGAIRTTYDLNFDPVVLNGSPVREYVVMEGASELLQEYGGALGLSLSKANGLGVSAVAFAGEFRWDQNLTFTQIAERVVDQVELARSELDPAVFSCKDSVYGALVAVHIPILKRGDHSSRLEALLGAGIKKYICPPHGMKDEPLMGVAGVQYRF